jgi:hypothetical protein
MKHRVQIMPPAPTPVSTSAIRSRQSAPGRVVEFELLRLCARLTVDSAVQSRIAALLSHELDWDFLIAIAHRHRVLPLVYRTLSRIVPHSIPEPAMLRFRGAIQANAKRNLFLTAALCEVIDLFRAHEIGFIPYKGPVVASLLYGDLSLRQFADLDIIVPVEDVARAKALLVSRGYRPERVMSEEQLRAFISTEKDITLLRDDQGINLEIHWGITTANDPISIRPQWLWEDLRPWAVAGRPVRTHSSEDLLLILCVHGAKHGWERLAWLCDVAEIVRSPGRLDWNRALERARRNGADRILYLGLALARDLLGAELPADVSQAIEADAVLKPLSEQVKGWLFSEEPVRLNLGERERYFMRLREHPADRFRVAVKQARFYLALTSRDKEALPVPQCLMWSLYLLRPVRLAREYGLSPFKRFVKGIFQS